MHHRRMFMHPPLGDLLFETAECHSYAWLVPDVLTIVACSQLPGDEVQNPFRVTVCVRMCARVACALSSRLLTEH